MTKEDILQKFLSAKVFPTRYTIQGILGISAQTLVRRGFQMIEIQAIYKEAIRKVKECPCCKINFSNLNNTYCSSSCAASVNNSKRAKRRPTSTKDVRVVVDKLCMCCGKILEKKQSKYCGVICQQKHVQEEYISKWLSGENVPNVKGLTVSSRIRRYLFKKHDCKCSRCSWGEINPTTGKSPLEVEHIDGDSNNNSPENLTLLCPNCHSLTNTYKALNKGNGRHVRMQRYKEGKSY